MNTNEPKRLYRSTRNKIAAGVWGGVGDYLSVDPVVLRIGYVALTAFTGIVPGSIAYIAMMFIVPEQPTSTTKAPEAPAPTPDPLHDALFKEDQQ